MCVLGSASGAVLDSASGAVCVLGSASGAVLGSGSTG